MVSCLVVASGILCAGPSLVPAAREMKLRTGAYRISESMPCPWYDWVDFDLAKACLGKAKYVVSRKKDLPPEGYELCVEPELITIVAADDAGEFYARETLKQLTTKVSTDTVEVACCQIRDWPQYRWRGLLIDEARHFLGKSAVKKIIDLMAMHKLNVLHWHLVDDQGWRIELKRHPELVEYGAARPCSVKFGTHAKWLPPDKKMTWEYDTERYGPFYYTQEDIREIVAYATDRHVTVVPEIELPGHVRALLAAHPEFSCKGDLPRIPRIDWSIEDDVLCVGNDASIRFLEEVFDEVCEQFPCSPYIHLGGDECPRVRWKDCPKCQSRIRSEGLDGECGLQSWITSHFVRYLEKKGRRVVGWDEILSGDVPLSTVGMTWRTSASNGAKTSYVSAAEAAEKGHDVVMAPNALCYLSYPQFEKEDPYPYYGVVTEPGQILTLDKTYSFDPVKGIPEAARRHVIGGQACVWGESTYNIFDFEWKTWPRGCAIAEVLWLGDAKPGVEDFRQRMETHRIRLLNNHVNCAPLK